jgi:hypothetical protein
MFGRQSDTAADAARLAEHATAVAADDNLPRWIRAAAMTVDMQADQEREEYTR